MPVFLGVPVDAAYHVVSVLAGILTPLVTVVMAAFVPLAAGLYLLTTTAWTLAERALMGRARRSGRGRPGCSSGAGRRAGIRCGPTLRP
jgi:hypothetical protein